MKIYKSLIFSFILLFFFSCKEEKPTPEVAEKIEIREWKPEDTRSIQGNRAKLGLITKTEKATRGYVLFNPSNSTKTFLIDKEGTVLHTWNGELMAPLSPYLLENGNLTRMEIDPDYPTFAAGGAAGRIREYDWDGNLLWDFELANEKELLHHDIEVLPNGNILAIAYEAKSPTEAMAAGMNPEHIAKAGVWPDKIIEIKPTKPSGGEIVWEWHLWDHLVQDFDPSKKNYGVLADNPRKININAHVVHDFPPMPEEQVSELKKIGMFPANFSSDNLASDFTHCNAVSYNPDLDQIVFSFKLYNEFYIIDHSTSTAEAKGSEGGKYGHGGDLLYRWGNPENYGRGGKEDRMLYNQHDAKFIPEGYPGAGDIMVFNNDIPNSNNKYPGLLAAMLEAKSPDPQISIADFGNYSAVYEVAPQTNEDGSYLLPESGPMGPKEPNWSYAAPDRYSFYSAIQSGAHRMKNGNTFITSGFRGRMFEVTPENEIVWEYWNPFNFQYRLPDGNVAAPYIPFQQFRATHYGSDYPAFAGKKLAPVSPQPEPFIFKMPPPPTEQDSVH
jgi:hypothetical protein